MCNCTSGNLEIAVEIDPLQRRYPGFENLQPANRAIVTPLPRRLETRSPGRADTADEDQPGIGRLGHLDREFAFADFTLSNHILNPMKCSVLLSRRTSVHDRHR